MTSRSNADAPAPDPNLFQILRSGPVLACAGVALLGGLFEVVPAFAPLRFLSAPKTQTSEADRAPDAPANLEVGQVELKVESRAQASMAIADAANRPKTQGFIGGQEAPLDLPQIAAEEPPVPILNPTGKALDGFFQALSKTQQKNENAVTRIAHFGDSIIVSDYVSGTLRQKLQETFGDAGHGYMLVANPWPAYFHNDVFRFATSGFKVSRIVGPRAKDGLYGLGGVTFSATRGAIAQWGTAEKGDFGRKVS